MVRFGNAYAGRLYRAARHDAALARTFLRVANLIEPPSRLLQPAIALRVLAGNLRRDRRAASGRSGAEPAAKRP
jgi:hypothetical protein